VVEGGKGRIKKETSRREGKMKERKFSLRRFACDSYTFSASQVEKERGKESKIAYPTFHTHPNGEGEKKGG